MRAVKFLIFISINLLVAFVLFTVYQLWRKDALTSEQLQSELQGNLVSISENAATLASKTREGLDSLNSKLSDEYHDIDWHKLRDDLKVSDDDLNEYKEFTKWAYEEVSNKGAETIMGSTQDFKPSQQKPKPPTEAAKPVPPAKPPEKANPVAPVIAQKAEAKKPALEVAVVTPAAEEPAKIEVAQVEHTPDSQDKGEHREDDSAGRGTGEDAATSLEMEVEEEPVARPLSAKDKKKLEMLNKAGEVLAKAKEMNRGALPGKPNYKNNLKNSIKLYEDAQREYAKIRASPLFTPAEKAEAETTISNINKQIYWGKKFSSVK